MTRVLAAVICAAALLISYLLPASAQDQPGASSAGAQSFEERCKANPQMCEQYCKANPQKCEEMKAGGGQAPAGAGAPPAGASSAGAQSFEERCKSNPQMCEQYCKANPKRCEEMKAGGSPAPGGARAPSAGAPSAGAPSGGASSAGAQSFEERCKSNPQMCEQFCKANPKKCEEMKAGVSPVPGGAGAPAAGTASGAQSFDERCKSNPQMCEQFCKANPKKCEEMKKGIGGADGGTARSATAVASVYKPEPVQKGPIVPSLVAARTAGVAPLAVFFDATGTTGGDTAYPFHELEYRWDFGDAASGNWKTTGKPKNKTTGAVAAHVFETPGTYTVTLTIVNAKQTVTATTSIVVADPNTVFAGSNTICVSAAQRPVAGAGGCPAGAEVKQSADWPTIVNSYAATGKRVLLNRGEIYSGSATAVLDRRGPGIIGAYGSGAKPVIRTTATDNGSMILGVKGTVDDWRVMDLDIDGQGDIHRNFMFGGGNVTVSRLLVLRVDAHDLGGGVGFFVGQSTPAVPDQMTLADSTVQRIYTEKNAGMVEASWGAGARLALLGNVFDDTTRGDAEHLIRIQYASRAVFSHNVLRRARDGKEMLALRAPCSAPCRGLNAAAFGTGDSAATKYVIISDNYIKTNTYVGVQVDTAAIDYASNSIIHDVILERNWYQTENAGQPAARACMRIRAVRVTVRNEICDLTNTPQALGITVQGALPQGARGANDIWIYNNTFYTGGAQNTMTMVMITDSAINNLSIRNNLAYGPNVPNTVGTQNKGEVVGPLVEDHNTAGKYSSTGSVMAANQMKDTSPNFVSRTPAAPADFGLNAGSYAIGSGAPVPVFSDFFAAPRAPGTAIDLGAVKHAR